ncbi:MAG TPA: hypothetical protein VFD74_04190 [Thermoleophilia bacterium]|nr:hypothetical protein [Thermoleophilia bacterium]
MDEHIDRLTDAMEEQLGPFVQAVGLAGTIPGGDTSVVRRHGRRPPRV